MKNRIGKVSLMVLFVITIVLLAANLVIQPARATKIDDAAVLSAVAVTDAIVDALALTNADILASQGAGGNVFYVDSGATGSATGLDWTNAEVTLEAAIANCTASAGDIIYAAPRHAESFTSEELDIDKIGIQIIGLGTGSNRPTITYAHANGEVAIGAASVLIKNIRFFSSIPDVLMGIEVESGVDFFTIEDCEFSVETDGTDEFAEAINFAGANEDCTVRNCVFNAKAGNSVAAILTDNATVDLKIIGNEIRGDYSSACIFGDAADLDILIYDNLLINGALIADGGANTEPAIEVANNTAGFIVDNRIVSDVATGLAMRVADDCTFMNNHLTDDDGDEFSGSVETTSATVTGLVDGD